MQDSESPEMAEASQAPQKRIEIQKIYIKDISYEAPGSPQIFTEQWTPQVGQDIRNSHAQLSEQAYESLLTVTITVRLADKVAYLIEVTQAGIFNLAGYEPKQLDDIFAKFCPAVLFPYVRETISDLSSRGGFPPLLLQHINFHDMYRAYLQQREAAMAQHNAGGDAPTH